MIGADHLEFKTFEMGGFIACGDMAKGVNHQSANGIELLIAESHGKVAVEVFNRGLRLDEEFIAIDALYIPALINVVFVLNFTNDFLQHIFDGHQPCNTTVLIDDNRHVVAVLSEFSQQHVQSLALRHHDRGP